jgi:hypothetical protein
MIVVTDGLDLAEVQPVGHNDHAPGARAARLRCDELVLIVVLG